MEPSLLVDRKEMLRLLNMSLSKYKRLLRKGVMLPQPVIMDDYECWRRSDIEAYVHMLPRPTPKNRVTKPDQT